MGMKRKSIVCKLTGVTSRFIESVDDKNIQELLKKNAIIAGGAINCMLMGEPVNDFDIYIKDKHACVPIAKYFVNKFKKQKGNNKHANTNMSVDITECNDIYGQERESVTIRIRSAGEAIDVGLTEDHEVTSWKDAGRVHKDEKYRVKYITQNSITFSHNMQLIIRFCGTPEEIIKNYDYEHAKCTFDYYKKELNIPPAAMESMLSKSLVYTGSLYPLCSIFRMRKFLKRGWRIGISQILKMVLQCHNIDWEDRDTISDQLIGVDSAYLNGFMAQLDGDLSKLGDKELVGYLINVVDRAYPE